MDKQFKPIVSVDIDDVLVYCAKYIIDFHNQNYDTNNTVDQINRFDLWKLWNCSKDEFKERLTRFTEEVGVNQIPEPLENAVESIDMLVNHFDFIKNTSRQAKLRPITIKTLEELFMPGFSKNLCFNY